MSTELATTTRPKASDQLATITGMDRQTMLSAIKAQCFKGNPDNISDAQLAAFVSIAAEMGVNPLLPGMLYAFPTQGGGIVPMMGPDGVFKKLAENPEVDSWEVDILPADPTIPPTHAIARIFRRGREKPLTKTCSLAEWKVTNNPNWSTRPRHMLELRALKQCARQIIHGIPYDEDERRMMEEINVTPQAEAPPAPERPAAPPRAKKGAAAVVENAKKEQAQQPPIDVPTTPVVEKSAEQPKTEPAPAPKVEPKVEPKPESTQPTPEQKPAGTQPVPTGAQATPAPFTDGETRTCICTVRAVEGGMLNYPNAAGEVKPTPSVSLVLAGDYEGNSWHPGGGEGTSKENVKPLPIYSTGAVLKFTLRGRKNKATTGPLAGKVAVIVDKVELPNQEAASDAPDFG